jgi:hypothetical protein
MVWTARELVVDALQLANVTSPELQTASGFQIDKGLYALNRILDFKQMDVNFVPYYKYITDIDMLVNQEEYFLENVSYVESVTFTYGTVRFPMQRRTNQVYYSSARVNNIPSFPSIYTTRRINGGTQLSVYFLPSQPFPMQILAKMYLENVNLDTDLELVYDRGYIEYLRFFLTKYICIYFTIPIPPEIIQQLGEIENTLRDLSGPTPQVSKISCLQGNFMMGWNYVNLDKSGWLPL